MLRLSHCKADNSCGRLCLREKALEVLRVPSALTTLIAIGACALERKLEW